MICSSAFWKQKCENLKKISLIFFKFQSIPTYSASDQRHFNRQVYCTGKIIYSKLNNYFFVSADRQTFLGFEMTANLRDTSPLTVKLRKLGSTRFANRFQSINGFEFLSIAQYRTILNN